MRILTSDEPYYEIHYGRGAWLAKTEPIYSLYLAEDRAILLMTETHSRDKDGPAIVVLWKDDKKFRKWTKIDQDTWKEWPVDAKS